MAPLFTGLRLSFGRSAAVSAVPNYSSLWSANVVNGQNAFDGSTSTYPSKNTSGNATLTFNPAITGVTQLRLFVNEDQDGSGQRYALVNGNSNPTGGLFGAWKDYTAQLGGTTLTSIGWVGTGNAASNLTLYAVEVNGVILVDGS